MLNMPKEDMSPIGSIVVPKRLSLFAWEESYSIIEAATNTVLPDVVTSSPSIDIDADGMMLKQIMTP
jgi:hypothetical protein